MGSQGKSKQIFQVKHQQQACNGNLISENGIT